VPDRSGKPFFRRRHRRIGGPADGRFLSPFRPAQPGKLLMELHEML
jgi:hypothetical protein